LVNYDKIKALADKEYKNMFLDRWSHVDKKNKESTKGLLSFANFILQVHRCLQQEKVIIYINPIRKYNFIHVDLDERFQVPTKNI